MKIGELARQSNCSAETIRYYEKEGLLPSPLRDQANNYRYYDHNHLNRLLFIRRCRALDMSHKEIKTILETCDSNNTHCGEINSIINKHLLHVQDKIESLQILERELQNLSEYCHVNGPIHQCGIIHNLEQIQETHLQKNTSTLKLTNKIC